MGGGKEKQKTNQQIEQNRQIATGEHVGYSADLAERMKQNNSAKGEEKKSVVVM